jgi:Ca-activated chloride channel family protein
MNEFHFLRPAWFAALVPALLLILFLWRRHGRATAWRSVVAPALLPHLLLGDGAGSARRWPLLLLGLAWLLAVTALAGPTWERQPQPVYRAPVDRVLVLDMSPSMAATDLRPDRLARARYAVRSLLSETREGRVALLVFGAEPHVVAPLTDDVATVEALLPALSVDILPVPGNRGAAALQTAGALLQRAGSGRGEVLLLSDGVDDPADSLAAIQALRAQGIRLSVLGVGTLEGAPVPTARGEFETGPGGKVRLARLDETGLMALARAGGGHYQRLGQGAVSAVLTQDAARDAARARSQREGVDRWVEQGPWLLLPLLLIAAGGFRRGWLGVVALLLLPPPQAHAFGWQDLWLRPDQQASRLLERGDAAAAAQRFDNPDWQATANYRAGDYAAAAEGFDGTDADSQYNRGNALARAGRLQEALAAYDQALEQTPELADARFNRDLVERLLRQQQQQGQGGSDATDSQQRDSQSGQPQQEQAGDAGQQGQDEAGAGGSQNAGTRNQEADGAQAGDSGDAQPQPTTQSQDRQQAGATNDASTAQGETGTGQQPDNNEQARADVTPTAQSNTPEQPGAAAQAGAAAPADGSADAERPQAPETPVAAEHEAPSEQQLALEQWLRQIPDDPAGLLRRKFMVEHLMRQKEGKTP